MTVECLFLQGVAPNVYAENVPEEWNENTWSNVNIRQYHKIWSHNEINSINLISFLKSVGTFGRMRNMRLNDENNITFNGYL